MDMFEEARALAITMKMRKLSQNEMAKSLGVSQSYVSNKLRLLGIDGKMQKQITEFSLTERHARALISLKDEKQRAYALDRICAQGLSVAQTEALVGFLKEEEVPQQIGKADKLKATEFFLDNLKNSVNYLSLIGISATHRISYNERKTWVTICISED